MKKTNIFIITMLIMIGYASSALAYSDTSEHWASDTIDKFSEYKVINGYTDGTFKPDDNMTRAEFIVVINRILGLTKESQKYIPDISRQDYFYSDVRKAVEAGIVKGDENGYIKPYDNITREEAVVILSRAFKVQEASSTKNDFADKEDISIWAKREMESFANKNYINGYLDNTIKPKNNISRAEALTIISRIIPNVLKTDVYSGKIDGNVLAFSDNIVLKNLTIDGNLIIRPSANITLSIKNVVVLGDLIVIDEEPKQIKEIKIQGDIFKLHEDDSKILEYVDEEYGIKFAVTDKATVNYVSGENINFNEEDLVLVDIKKSNDYYLKHIKTIGREEIAKYANTFSLVEEGEINNYPYLVFDDKEDTKMIVIKRDNVVYTLISFNIVSENFIDNIVSTIELLPTENVDESENVIYKNSKLSLKFTYKDIYVSVDDSYNTGVINDIDAFFKLFIQVTTITDIQDYNINQIKELLKQLARNDGKILETDVFKVMGNDAIKLKIQAENEKIIYSLYVVVGNNLYNFIFKGNEVDMNEVGRELFDEIIKSVEF